jgi:hypothetical protein
MNWGTMARKNNPIFGFQQIAQQSSGEGAALPVIRPGELPGVESGSVSCPPALDTEQDQVGGAHELDHVVELGGSGEDRGQPCCRGETPTE